MTRESSGMNRFPATNFHPAGRGPEPIREFGSNISGLIVETFLFYVQGLFMDPGLDHQFSYNEHDLPGKRIHIVDPMAFQELATDAYPRIVVDRGNLQGMGRGGINNLASMDWYTGEEKRVDMFSCPIEIRIYGTYDKVEQYGSRIFLALRFLTEPLKYFTIYKVANPGFSRVVPYKMDTKPGIFRATVSAVVYKEGSMRIRPTHYPVLRRFAFVCKQVFQTGTTKVKVRIS